MRSASRMYYGAPVVASLLLVGCGAPPRDQGFAEIHDDIQQRTQVDVRWMTGGSEDHAVAQQVSELIAQPLTVDTAVHIAVLNNPQLHAVYQQLGVSQAELVQAGLLANPMLSASVKFFEAGPQLELSLVQGLLSVFTIPARRRFAGAELAAAKARVEGAIIDLIGDVRRATYRYDGAQQNLALRQESFAALSASTELAKRIHDAGNSTDLAFATESAALEEARIDLAAEEAKVLSAREDVNVLLGLWGAQAATWTTIAELPELPDEDGTGDGTGLETAAIRANVELTEQREDIRAMGERYGIERLDAWFGDAEVGVTAERDPDGSWGVGPEVGIALPIFNQGQGRRAEATARMEMAARTYWATAVEIRSQARRLRAQVRAAFARAQYQDQVLIPLRVQVVQQTLLHYNGMLVGPFQLIAAKREELAARAALIDSQTTYWLASASLSQLRHGRMAPSLDATPMTLSSSSAEKTHD